MDDFITASGKLRKLESDVSTLNKYESIVGKSEVNEAVRKLRIATNLKKEADLLNGASTETNSLFVEAVAGLEKHIRGIAKRLFHGSRKNRQETEEPTK